MLWDDGRVRCAVQNLVMFCSSAAVFGRATGPSLSPTNIFAPASTSAQPIFELSSFVLSITAAIFVVVFALLAYSVVKFRRRREDDGREPPQVHGSNQAGLAWTVIPILIVVTLFWQQRE
jgi:cytochrome c oxidase subunit 2